MPASEPFAIPANKSGCAHTAANRLSTHWLMGPWNLHIKEKKNEF